MMCSFLPSSNAPWISSCSLAVSSCLRKWKPSSWLHHWVVCDIITKVEYKLEGVWRKTFPWEIDKHLMSSQNSTPFFFYFPLETATRAFGQLSSFRCNFNTALILPGTTRNCLSSPPHGQFWATSFKLCHFSIHCETSCRRQEGSG